MSDDKYSTRRTYDKLVRDKIPEYLESKGVKYKAHTADESEYWTKLKAKLSEEAGEFSQTNPSKEELADILEVIYAIIDHLKIDKAELEAARLSKLQNRGGFKKRIILEES